MGIAFQPPIRCSQTGTCIHAGCGRLRNCGVNMRECYCEICKLFDDDIEKRSARRGSTIVILVSAGFRLLQFTANLLVKPKSVEPKRNVSIIPSAAIFVPPCPFVREWSPCKAHSFLQRVRLRQLQVEFTEIKGVMAPSPQGILPKIVKVIELSSNKLPSLPNQLSTPHVCSIFFNQWRFCISFSTLYRGQSLQVSPNGLKGRKYILFVMRLDCRKLCFVC